MRYDYFYGQQAELFAFYRVPKLLFQDAFRAVSTDAKLLYGILLDRMELSARNDWRDGDGRIYIIFTIEEVKHALGCAEKKAVKLLDELEKKCALIERKRQGLGKPNLIYVKNFTSDPRAQPPSACGGGQFLTCQKDNSVAFQSTTPELSKAQGKDTDSKETDYSDTDPIPSFRWDGSDGGEAEKYQAYLRFFQQQISMDRLKRDFPYDEEILDLILHLIVEVMCSKRKMIRVAGDDKPVEIVRASLMKLDSEHISYVMQSFKANASEIRNVKQYLLASIYNAPYTISAHYDAMVRHDFAAGRI